MRKFVLPFLLVSVASTLSVPQPASAEDVVQIGGGSAMLNRPKGKPKAGIILLPGGDGNIGIGSNGSIQRQGNWIVRYRGSYRRAGMASLLLDQGADVGSAINYMRKLTPRVIVVAMSRGSLKVPGSLSYRPNGIVFVSSMLSSVQGSLGSAASLPPTLVIHHQNDQCRVTNASDVPGFAQWGGSRVRVKWISGGGSPRGRICGAFHWHGFPGREGAVVSAITGFAQRVR